MIFFLRYSYAQAVLFTRYTIPENCYEQGSTSAAAQGYKLGGHAAWTLGDLDSQAFRRLRSSVSVLQQLVQQPRCFRNLRQTKNDGERQSREELIVSVAQSRSKASAHRCAALLRQVDRPYLGARSLVRGRRRHWRTLAATGRATCGALFDLWPVLCWRTPAAGGANSHHSLFIVWQSAGCVPGAAWATAGLGAVRVLVTQMVLSIAALGSTSDAERVGRRAAGGGSELVDEKVEARANQHSWTDSHTTMSGDRWAKQSHAKNNSNKLIVGANALYDGARARTASSRAGREQSSVQGCVRRRCNLRLPE